MYICIDATFLLHTHILIFLHRRLPWLHVRERDPNMCFQVDFNFQKEKCKLHLDCFSRDALLHLLDKDFRALQ